MTNETIEILKGYRERLKQSVSNQLEADIKAFDEAIKALESQRWIPVSERLPHNHEEVIVTCRVGEEAYVDKAWFVSTKEKHRFFGTDNEVIAWMPLPQPYKAESNKGGGKRRWKIDLS